MSDGAYAERLRRDVDLEKLELVVDAVRAEVVQAMMAHTPAHSDHEAFAVAHEEFDELWDAVKLNPKKHPERDERVEKEGVQSAAMMVRLLYDRGFPCPKIGDGVANGLPPEGTA